MKMARVRKGREAKQRRRENALASNEVRLDIGQKNVRPWAPYQADLTAEDFRRVRAEVAALRERLGLPAEWA